MTRTDRKNPTRAKSSESQYSLMEFMREFPDDDACLDWLWRNRFSNDGETTYCPKCEQVRTFRQYKTKQRRQSWTCVACGHHVHPTAGTIFHKSSTSLHLWFYAIYLMTSTRCGISAKQLERELGVTYKTAWRMAKLIRTELMDDDIDTLSGEVEIDETYVGGRPRHRLGRRGPRMRNDPSAKVPVLGMVERGGRVLAMPVADNTQRTLLPHVREKVLPESVIYTDEYRVYNRLGRERYTHKRINHSQRVYVSGDVHTNTIEGFWSLFKNGIRGVYHGVSAKHLQGYLNEYAWRYNRRGQERAMFESLLLRAAGS